MQALIFDLDGTLVDTVYAHTFAWQKTLLEFGLQSPAWAIHRRVGMSGKLLVKGIAREHGRTLSDAVIKKLDEQHTSLFRELAPDCATPPPGKAASFFCAGRS
jgi:beta-phosphoglucomutase-like phosphatase (HAD superfamily)